MVGAECQLNDQPAGAQVRPSASPISAPVSHTRWRRHSTAPKPTKARNNWPVTDSHISDRRSVQVCRSPSQAGLARPGGSFRADDRAKTKLARAPPMRARNADVHTPASGGPQTRAWCSWPSPTRPPWAPHPCHLSIATTTPAPLDRSVAITSSPRSRRCSRDRPTSRSCSSA